MRILVDENIPQGDSAFAPYGQVQRFAGRKLQRADLQEAQALIVRSITRVNADLLEGTPVRFVGTATIGTDHVDLDWLKKSGIGFASAPGCNANSVAEYIVAALLELQAEKGLPLERVQLGIVGYGNVGRRVRQKAEALGLKVWLCDPPLQEAGSPETFHSLATLLKNCNVISLHVPLVKKGPHPTLGLFNADALAQLPGPITLFNTCRGEVTEEAALLEGRKSGRLRHLILDVFPGEPNPNPALWRSCDFISPHVAGYSLQGKLGGTQQVLAAFCQHFGLPSPASLPEPMPASPVLALSATGPADSPWAAVRQAVTHAYSLRDEDARLRVALSEADPGAAFDRLRRDYPIRHEFTRYRVAEWQTASEATRKILLALGFGVV